MRLVHDLSLTGRPTSRPLYMRFLPPGGGPGPSFAADFVNRKYMVAGRNVDAEIAYNHARASTARSFDNAGILTRQDADTPRFDHDPATGLSLGLLIEESRTNVLLWSSEIGNWARDNLTISANSEMAPDGTVSADSLVEPNDMAKQHRAKQIISVSEGRRYTLSAYARSSNRGARLLLWNGAWSAALNVDLQTGSVLSTGGMALVAGSVEPAGNAWYRLMLTVDAPTTDIAQVMLYTLGPGNSASYDGDGVSSVAYWGVQLEEGGTASSLIETSQSPVTRVADNAHSDTLGWLVAGQGTLFVEATWTNLSDTSFNAYAAALRRNGSNLLGIRSAHFTNGGVQAVSVVDAQQQAPLFGGTPMQGVSRRMAFAYASDDFALSVDGAEVVRDESGQVPGPVTELAIGQLGGGAGQLNGHIRRLIYYPVRLGDAALREMTG